MQYMELGDSGLKVSRIAFGSMSIVANPTYSGVEETQAIEAIHTAYDAGINFFDTAPGYGNGAAEVVLGRALAGGLREKVIVADKINTPSLTAQDVETEFALACERLNTDYIDLYQIHWPKNVVPVEETLRAMENLVTSGRVRSLGVSNFGPVDLTEALGVCSLVSNQIAYNLLNRAPEFEVVEIMLKHNMGMLCYSPIAQGLLAGKFSNADEVPDERARTRIFASTRPQARHSEPGCETEAFEAIAGVRAVAERVGQSMADVSIAWLLAQPTVTSVLVGASMPEQVKRNAAAADVKLSQQDLDELSSITESVKQILGPNMDVWQTESRIR
ncbi:aldo/keto reductase [Mucisphaera calidilacus]|uniref:General stress protein 69 n=1 Tax=Mucisphaera calidilacus TaxID=2527982 RepID=A0A518BUS9_9BACT|nr:aldo/keto reductase [Mucisphaera calidilacus]QDU70738.1 General stress protein 69 [Mucisphaera calidilacus]